MSQPLNRSCELPELGSLDKDTGEFWPRRMFDMPKDRQNLSAFERNHAMLNMDGKSFLKFSHASGCDLDSDSRSVVAADFNRDGKTDLLVGSVGGGPLRLFYNRFGDANQRVNIELVGTESNRQGIGARVIAYVEAEQGGERKIVRDVFPENACFAQAPTGFLLGTGTADVIKRLVVRWPTGKLQEFKDVPAKGSVQITEGEAKLKQVLEFRL